MSAMDQSWVAILRAFVDACKKEPALLADTTNAFFRDSLLSLGADLPHAAKPGPKVGPPISLPSVLQIFFSA